MLSRSQASSRKGCGSGAAQCFTVPSWYQADAMFGGCHLPTSSVHALQPCGDPCVQPSLGVHLLCLVGTDRGHWWGGVLHGASCHMSRELSLRQCPVSSVQGLFCQGPAGYQCGHYLHSPPLHPGLWCPLESHTPMYPEAPLA